MTSENWKAFCTALSHYRALIGQIRLEFPELPACIQSLVDTRDGPLYTVERAVVYNEALDDLDETSEIKMILVGDNPGRREQECGLYLVGPSGKIAENFFRNNSELGIDFRKNVLILNKTPIHTPRTACLKTICATGGSRLETALRSSQQAMAVLLDKFHEALTPSASAAVSPPALWIIGYSEMKKGGIFESYTQTVMDLCAVKPRFAQSILFFRHFSMNQFAIDLKNRRKSEETTAQTLTSIGQMYRKRILGF